MAPRRGHPFSRTIKVLVVNHSSGHAYNILRTGDGAAAVTVFLFHPAGFQTTGKAFTLKPGHSPISHLTNTSAFQSTNKYIIE